MLGASWVVDGMTSGGILLMLSHNGVQYVTRRIHPDGSTR